MNNTPWTAEETALALALRDAARTHAQIGNALGRSTKAVEKKLAKLRIRDLDSLRDRDLDTPMRAPVSKESPWNSLIAPDGTITDAEFPGIKFGVSPTSAEKTCEERAAYWKLEAQRLQSMLTHQQHDKTAVDILVEAAHELAPKSYQPAPFRKTAHKSSDSQPQSAVLLLSDTHCGQVVEAEQTLGFGGYNFDIFLRRLAHLERSIMSILQDHTKTPVDEIVVAMLGDFLHGNLQHAVEAGQQSTVFSQLYSAGHAISQFLRNLSSVAPLRIHAVVGNHSRMPNQHKMPCDNRYSNFDFFLLAYLQALTKDIERITWNLDKQPFAVFTVKSSVFQVSHGDELRGADRALGIPNHSVGRRVSTTTQARAMTGQPPVNYYCCGHLHKPIELPHSLGEVLVNGGFPGVDGYGVSAGFTPSRPSQKFFLLHEKYGRTASYNLRLDFGDDTPHGYILPENFICK